MRNMKRILCVAAVLALVLTAFAGCKTPSAPGPTTEIVLLHTNDTHGRVAGNDTEVIGIDRIAAIHKGIPNSLLLDAGDALHGLPIATLLRGADIIALMGEAGYDAMAVGNHEFNYGWARYTQNFTPGFNGASLFQIQNTANEYSLGWVVTPPHPIFGFQPFVSAGAGSTEFKPTAGGGEGAPKQARATYYYNVGLQREFPDSHFGVRVSFRQNFFLAPDFGQNYLTILQHTTTIQPTAGFFLRF